MATPAPSGMSAAAQAVVATYRNCTVTLDVGTAATRVVVMERGKQHPVLVRNDLANESTPTVIAFPVDQEILVGDVAAPFIQSRPLQAVNNIPALLALDFSDEEARQALVKKTLLPNALSENGVDIPSFGVYGAPFPPSLLLLVVIKKALHFVRKHYREGFRAESAAEAAELGASLASALPSGIVITLPEALEPRAFTVAADAAQLAGFAPEAILVIRDTQAATAAFAALRAVAFAEELAVGSAGRVAIVNVGAGYTSVSVVDVAKDDAKKPPRVVPVVAVGIASGSQAIDLPLFEEVLGKCSAKAPDGIPLRGRTRILDQCRKAKVILSTAPAASISAEAISACGMVDARESVTQQEFTAFAAPFASEVRELVEKALQSATESADAVAPADGAVRVEVIGGGWRTPAVADAITAAAHTTVANKTLDAATAVGFGGAYLSAFTRVAKDAAVHRARENALRAAELATAVANDEAAKAAADAAASAPELESEDAAVKTAAEATKATTAAAAAKTANLRKTAEELAAVAASKDAAGVSAEEQFWLTLGSSRAPVSPISEAEKTHVGELWAGLAARDEEYLALAVARNAYDEAIGEHHLKASLPAYTSRVSQADRDALEALVQKFRDWIDEEVEGADDEARAERLLPTGRTAAEYTAKLAELNAAVAEQCPAVAKADADIAAERAAEDERSKAEADKAAQERDPKSDPERIRVAKMRRDQGNEFFKKGDHMTEAAQRYTQALACLDNMYDEDTLKEDRVALFVSCHLNLAAIAVHQKDWKGVVTHAKKVLGENAQHPKALFRLGQGYTGLSDFPEARSALSKARDLVPNDPAIERAWADLERLEGAYKKKQKSMASRMMGAFG